jgi:hypothetical protein
MQKRVRTNVTTHALRCFDRAGGLDQYLLHTKWKRLDEGLTRTLRVMVESSLRRAAEERAWAANPEAAKLYAANANTAPTAPPLVAAPASEVALPGLGNGVRLPSALELAKMDPATAAATAALPLTRGSANPKYRHDKSRPAAPARVVPVRQLTTRPVSMAELALSASATASPRLDIWTKAGPFAMSTPAASASAVPADAPKSVNIDV